MIQQTDAVSPPEDKSFGHWVSGFTDGEGCFYLGASKKGVFLVKFELRLRRDDSDILAEIHRFFGVGHLDMSCMNNGFEQTAFRVHKISDVVRVIIPHFDAFPLRSKKRRDYATWREAAMLYNSVQVRARAGRRVRGERRWLEHEAAEFLRLRAELQESRRYGPSVARAAELKASRGAV